jgi:hypothetical protein
MKCSACSSNIFVFRTTNINVSVKEARCHYDYTKGIIMTVEDEPVIPPQGDGDEAATTSQTSSITPAALDTVPLINNEPVAFFTKSSAGRRPISNTSSRAYVTHSLRRSNDSTTHEQQRSKASFRPQTSNMNHHPKESSLRRNSSNNAAPQVSFGKQLDRETTTIKLDKQDARDRERMNNNHPKESSIRHSSNNATPQVSSFGKLDRETRVKLEKDARDRERNNFMRVRSESIFEGAKAKKQRQRAEGVETARSKGKRR